MPQSNEPTRAQYTEALNRRNTGDYLNLPASLVTEDHRTIQDYEARQESRLRCAGENPVSGCTAYTSCPDHMAR